MIKLLLCIFGIFAISASLLHLRQEKLNYRYQMNQAHDKIEGAQARLWNQQLKVAMATTPEALGRVVMEHGGLPGEEPGAGGAGGPGGKRWLEWRGER